MINNRLSAIEVSLAAGGALETARLASTKNARNLGYVQVSGSSRDTVPSTTDTLLFTI